MVPALSTPNVILFSGLTCLEIHSAVSRDLASAATLVMCERDVSVAYPFGRSSTGSSPVAVASKSYPQFSLAYHFAQLQ